MKTQSDGQSHRRVTRQQFLGTAGSLGIAGLLAACGSSGTGKSTTATKTTTAAGKPKSGGTLSLATTFSIPSETLDPAQAAFGGASIYCSNLYDRLLRWDNNWNTQPELAESWKSNSAGTEWTFNLRPGLKFSDGSPLTTKDVRATMLHVLEPKVGSSAQGRLAAELKPSGIHVIDDRTIRFNLQIPDSEFDLFMGDRPFGITKEGTASDKQPVGAGPFVTTQFTPGQSWAAERNEHYWRAGLPYLDGVQYVNQAQTSTLLTSVLSGKTDLAGSLDFAQGKQVTAGQGANLIVNNNAAFIYAPMNSKVKPFDNPKVVQAIKLAADRHAIVNTAFAGYGNATSDIFLWPQNPFYPPSLGVRGANITQAKQLLKDGGYPNGLDIELFTSSVTGGFVDYATAFSQVVAQAGIHCKITQTPPATYYTKTWLKEPMFVSYGTGRSPVSEMNLYFVPGAIWPETNFTSPELTKLVRQAAATTDLTQRQSICHQAFLIIANEASMSVPAAVPTLWATKDNVHGVVTSGLEHLRLYQTYMS